MQLPEPRENEFRLLSATQCVAICHCSLARLIQTQSPICLQYYFLTSMGHSGTVSLPSPVAHLLQPSWVMSLPTLTIHPTLHPANPWPPDANDLLFHHTPDHVICTTDSNIPSPGIRPYSHSSLKLDRTSTRHPSTCSSVSFPSDTLLPVGIAGTSSHQHPHTKLLRSS